MTAISTRRKPAADSDLEQLVAAAVQAALEQERQDNAIRDRILAKVAAQLAPGKWHEFQQLLTGQYSVSYTDASRFVEILTGRRQ
jgi:hypothetical protein